MVFIPLYTGRLFHCYTLDESICHFMGFGSVFVAFIIFLMVILLPHDVDPDQTPHDRSKLGLHCLSMILLRVSR